MTRDDAVSFIQFELGQRSDLTDAIVARLQQAQRLLEQGRTLPYFLKEEAATLTVTSGTGEISLPTGFLREVDDEQPHFTATGDTEPTFLEKLTYEEAVRRFAGVAAGGPQAYVLRKTGMLVYPERDTSYSLTWSYYKSGTSLATNVSDNAWLVYAPDILIGYAGRLIAEPLGHKAAADKFTQLYATAWQSAIAETILREEVNDRIAVGGRL